MSRKPKPTQQLFEETQHTLLHLGAQAAAKLLAKPHDLVMVLAHGGLGPLWALEQFWALTQTRPMPPVMLVNFGLEKSITRLKPVMRDFSSVSWPLMGGFLEPISHGYALHWVSQQKHWQGELCQMVVDVLGNRKPWRILVLDETQFEGTTILLFLGLLHDLFPQTAVETVMEQSFVWRETFVRYWRQASIPPEYDDSKIYELLRPLLPLVTGTLDVHPESLAWKPLAADDTVLEEARAICPTEDLLALSGWAQGQIKAYVTAHAHEIDLEAWVVREKLLNPNPMFSLAKIFIPTLVMKQAWNVGYVTRKDVLALNPTMSPSRATKILRKLVQRWALLPEGRFRGRYYVPVSGKQREKFWREWLATQPPAPELPPKKIPPQIIEFVNQLFPGLLEKNATLDEHSP